MESWGLDGRDWSGIGIEHDLTRPPDCGGQITGDGESGADDEVAAGDNVIVEDVEQEGGGDDNYGADGEGMFNWFDGELAGGSKNRKL